MIRIFALAVSLMASVGCSRTHHPLSGTVTFDDKPVPTGEILLTPDTGRGNRAPSVVVEISHGKYSTPPERGQWGGAYKAVLSGFTPGGKKTLFYNHEVEIDLPVGASTYDFVVPASAASK